MYQKSRKIRALSVPSILKGGLASILIAGLCFGATILYLNYNKNLDSQSLDNGLAQINRGEYARAVKSLTNSLKHNAQNPDIYLALAQAYVGTDEIDQAWDCIEQARSHGKSIANCPQLATQLANYYSKKNEFAKAIDILRPLVKETTPEKKSELADLDALWGDECLSNNKLEQALTCWEEVKQLSCGTRLPEADQKLATIYQRLANNFANNKQDKEALGYLAKLNSVSQNYKSHEMAADLYERDGQTSLAIAELKKAQELTDSSLVKSKLVNLLVSYGKSLINNGDNENGLAYLQEAQKLDNNIEIPELVLKNVNINSRNNKISLTGTICNNGENPINNLSIKVELSSKNTNEPIYKNEKDLIDQFSQALKPQESRDFEFICQDSIPKYTKDLFFNVYINNTFYQTYALNQPLTPSTEPKIETATSTNTQSNSSTDSNIKNINSAKAPNQEATGNTTIEKTSEHSIDNDTKENKTNTEPENNEEKTLKDLDL